MVHEAPDRKGEGEVVEMNVTVRRVTEWSDALDRARITAGKPALERRPR